MSFWICLRIVSNKWDVEMNLEVVEDASTGSVWQRLEVLKLEECHSELVSESHQISEMLKWI